MTRYENINGNCYNSDQLLGYIADNIASLGGSVDNICTQLKRIVDSLETTDNKTKEEILNKVKQALEK